MTLRTTNFATPRAARTRTWSLGLWLAALACLVLAVWLGTKAVDLNNQTAQLAAHMDGTSEVAAANAAEQVNVPTATCGRFVQVGSRFARPGLAAHISLRPEIRSPEFRGPQRR